MPWRTGCEVTGRRVAEVRARERALVSRLAGTNGDDLDRLMALVEGLRMALCAPIDPMPVERALALLSDDPSSRAAN